MINERLKPPRLVDLTDIQAKYLLDDFHRFTVLSAGRRSRKTLMGKAKLIRRACETVGNYFAAAPTIAQAKRIFWKDLVNWCYYFTKSINKTDMEIHLLNGSMIAVVGLDKAYRLEGSEWHGCLITEMGNIKSEVWQENIRPALSDTNGFAMLDGVPEGRNHYYDIALYSAGHSILPTTYPILGAYASRNDEWAFYTWFSSDVLSAGEIQQAQDELDEKTFKQEYEGSFESYEGLAYYSFSQDNIDNSIQYNSNYEVVVGHDFNVNPMSCALCHDIDGTIQQFGELYMRNANTYESGEKLRELFGVSNVKIYPDSSGKSRSSNATQSDLAILRGMGFRIYAKSSNPRVKDRVAAVNAKMRNAAGKVAYKINADNCKETIKDFQKVERDAYGDIVKDDLMRTHVSDALGYFIAYKYPLRKSVGKELMI